MSIRFIIHPSVKAREAGVKEWKDLKYRKEIAPIGHEHIRLATKSELTHVTSNLLIINSLNGAVAFKLPVFRYLFEH